MKKILLILCLTVNTIFANSGLVTGYGISEYDVPIINYDDVISHHLFVGVNNYYPVNESDEIVMSGIFSTNRRNDISLLSEIELQMSFRKYVVGLNSIAVGFHIAHLLNENIPEVDLVGTGFGVNLAYTHTLTSNIEFSFQIHSTSYGVLTSTIGQERFTNQTIRSSISYTPN